MHNAETLILAFLGLTIFYGFKQMMLNLAGWLSSWRVPDHNVEPELTVVIPRADPIVSRRYCIGCGHLVKRTSMAWQSGRFTCDECESRTRV